MRTFITGLLVLTAASLMAQTAPARLPLVAVQSVSLTSDSIVSSANLQQIDHEITQQLYSPSSAESRIADTASQVLKNDGYFKSDASVVSTEVLNETPNRRQLSVTLRIREGEQYRLKEITFENNKLFPDAQLRAAFDIKDGDLMSEEKVLQGLYGVRKIYSYKGYLELNAFDHRNANDETRSVSLHVEIEQGPQFTVNGIYLEDDKPWPPDKAERLRALARAYQGGHNVEQFIDDVKAMVTEMFPGYDARTLVGVTQGTEKHIATVQVNFPEGIPAN